MLGRSCPPTGNLSLSLTCLTLFSRCTSFKHAPRASTLNHSTRFFLHLLIDETARLIHGLEHGHNPALTIFTSCLLFFPRHETTKNKYFKNRKNTCPLAAAPSTARPRTGLRVIQFHSQACLKPPKRNLRCLLRSSFANLLRFTLSVVCGRRQTCPEPCRAGITGGRSR